MELAWAIAWWIGFGQLMTAGCRRDDRSSDDGVSEEGGEGVLSDPE